MGGCPTVGSSGADRAVGQIGCHLADVGGSEQAESHPAVLMLTSRCRPVSIHSAPPFSVAHYLCFEPTQPPKGRLVLRSQGITMRMEGGDVGKALAQCQHSVQEGVKLMECPPLDWALGTQPSWLGVEQTSEHHQGGTRSPQHSVGSGRPWGVLFTFRSKGMGQAKKSDGERREEHT